MSRPFDEDLKAKWTREDKERREQYQRSKPLEIFEQITNGRQALADNASHLGPKTHPILWNFTGAFISAFAALRKIEERLDLLENKVDLVLRSVKEDND